MELREYIKRQGLTVSEFAQLIGYSHSQIAKILAKERRPSPRLTKHIIEFTKNLVTYEELRS